MKLGLVTYNMARDWDVPTLIANCRATRFEAVELRTTHAHGVEPSLSAAERQAIRHQFAGSGVRLLSLGTACEYDSPDPEIVPRQIAETREFVRLGHDLGCLGVKVRPNGLHEKEGVPAERRRRFRSKRSPPQVQRHSPARAAPGTRGLPPRRCPS